MENNLVFTEKYLSLQLLLLIIAEIKRIYLAFILITNEYEKEIYCFSLEKRDRDLGDLWGLSQNGASVAYS